MLKAIGSLCTVMRKYKADMRLNFTMCFLGFSSGLPLLLVGTTLQSWYASKDINIAMIGALSLIGMPYLFKCIWAPLLDTFHVSSGSGRKFWILCMQLLLTLSLFAISFCAPDTSSFTLLVLSCVTAFFSATQDVAIDAYRQVITPEYLRPQIVTCSTVGYRIAMLFSGGIALVWADYYGWAALYRIMALTMFVVFLYSWSTLKPYLEDREKDVRFMHSVIEPLRAVLRVRGILVNVSCIITYKLSDAFLLSLLQPFLITSMGYSLSYVGWLVKVFGLGATLVGACFASVIWKKTTKRYAFLICAWMQSIAVLLFVLLAHNHNHYLAIMAVISESFASGATTCLLVSMIMGISCKRYAASHVALFTALSSMPRVLLGPLAGYISLHYGWVEFFAWCWLLSLPSIIILYMAKKHDFAIVAST